MFQQLRTFLFTIICVFTSSFSFAQKNWPNTLLWRISGNGLSRPSYLYGTMHLQDKRLFNFGDSLYHGLESVEGFAVEIDFKEYFDSLFMKGIRHAEDNLLAKEKVKIDKKKLDKSADSLFKKLGINKDNVTKKDLKKIRDYRINKYVQQGEMQTIVDGYLFGLALRQGKWMGGIEDVSDQLNLADELGAELTPEKVLEPDGSMRKGLEQMIQIYQNQDLQSINIAINGYDAACRDALLTRRNIKMARRMDSLSSIRTMFFAVGAAHLPGDSGVIYLLRRRGFTVDPVFSAKKIAAETYAKKLQGIPWYKVEDENKLYTVEMPGNPSQFNEFGEVLKMKMFFDITTMTFYLSSQTIGKITSVKDFEQIFKNIAGKMGASSKRIRPKSVARNGLQAMEESFEMDDFTFRVQLLHKDNSLYILMAGSNKKANLATSDVNRFFTSFSAHEINASDKEWVKFNLPEKAVSVKLPGQPKRNLTIDKQSAGTNWNFTTYDYVDNAKGMYFMMQVKDLNEGFYLDSDSVYLASYAEDAKKRMDSVLRKDIVKYKSFPALYLDALYDNNITYKTMHVIRGNRVYSLMLGAQSNTVDAEAANYFQSLELEDYPVSEWKQYASEGFYTTAPAPIKRLATDTTEGSEMTKRELFVSHNPFESISYEVIKEPFPKHYWTQNDSSYFEWKATAFIGEADSLLSKTLTTNGQLKSLDMLVQKSHQNNLQKLRLLVNGDTLYTLIAYIPRQYIDNGNHQKFFEGFRINTEVPPSIYASKAKTLMEALKTKDSTTFAQALEVFNAVQFGKQDLPYLHNSLLHTFCDSTSSDGVHEAIVNVIADLADSTTVEFAASTYLNLPAEKESLRYPLLEILANVHTQQAYDLIKQLLLTKLPSEGSSASLESALTDSLTLTRTLFPDVLRLCKDSTFAEALVSIADRLLDSSYISISDLSPYKTVFFKQAEAHYHHLKNDQTQWWQYFNWVSFLAKFNENESNDLLQQYARLPIQGLKYRTIIALLKNGQQVSTAEIEKLAADNDFRTDLYEELKNLNKLRLFPAKFAKQQSMAESQVYLIASDDYEVDHISFIGERVASYDGSKKKFYLYKVTLSFDEGEKESYLGIAGPYDPNSKELITYADASGVYWDEKFEKQKTEQQLKTFIAQIEAAED